MKRVLCLAAGVVFLAAGLSIINVKASKVQDPPNQQAQAPEITGARSNGKKLWVTGDHFNEGAVILINGEAVGTRNDPDNPAGMLIAKKGGKRMPPDAVTQIAVQNLNGAKSAAFDFFSGLTITLEDAGKTISLAIGQKFEVFLKKNGYEWAAGVFDPAIVIKLQNEQTTPGSQGIFQAVGRGKTELQATGGLPCLKSNPPCLAPSLGFNVMLVVE